MKKLPIGNIATMISYGGIIKYQESKLYCLFDVRESLSFQNNESYTELHKKIKSHKFNITDYWDIDKSIDYLCEKVSEEFIKNSEVDELYEITNNIEGIDKFLTTDITKYIKIDKDSFNLIDIYDVNIDSRYECDKYGTRYEPDFMAAIDFTAIIDLSNFVNMGGNINE